MVKLLSILFCAWILWVQSTTTIRRHAGPDAWFEDKLWTAEFAFESKADCEARISKMIMDNKKVCWPVGYSPND